MRQLGFRLSPHNPAMCGDLHTKMSQAMKLPQNVFLVLAASAVLWSPSVHAQTATIGLGVAKCALVTGMGAGKLGGQSIAIQAEALMWVQGYLSALSAVEAAEGAASAQPYSDALGSTTAETLSKAVDAFCRLRPLLILREATFDVYRQLGGRVLRER